MKNMLFLCTASFLLLSSCASLTKSQVTAVNQFAKTTKDFSAYPSKIMTSLADVRVKRGVYFVNSLEDPDGLDAATPQEEDMADSLRELTVQQHVRELDSIFEQKKRTYRRSKKADITFKIIDGYAKALLLLSSDKHGADLQSQAASFGTSLDSLIGIYNRLPDAKPVPGGIGGLIGGLIMAGGKQWIRSKQANEIKRFVTSADQMVGTMTDNLLEFLTSGKIDSLILNEKQAIAGDYRSFLRHRTPGVQNERDYLELKADVDQTDILRNQTIEATKDLRKAHAKLTEEIREKKTLNEVIGELQELYEDVRGLKDTIETMNILTINILKK